ncbi:MAG: NAD(P)-dependent oxidoreductase [bacterium]|nr:NAD(P)-dependent oxidoreductase [bacterium]
MKKKQSLLVIGCYGFLGSNIVNRFRQYYDITGIDKSRERKTYDIKYFEVDVTNKMDIKTFLTNNKFDIVLHCAAIVDVDFCELNFQQAWEVNALGTKNVVEGFNGLFIYISTDMLFNGIKGEYSEIDIPNPINNYGKTKLEGENFVRQYSKNHLILRTNFFGWNHYSDKQTFVEWIYNSLKNGEEISLFYDYIFCPIFIYDFIDIISSLINSEVRGTYNVVGKNAISKLDFGEMIADKFNLDKNMIKRVSIKDHNFIAKRPHNMSLKTTKLSKHNIHIPTIDVGIDHLFTDFDN